MQGEVGQSKINHFTCLEDAKKDFEKKFREKTKNSWAERDHFVAHPGKYTLIEVQREAETLEAVVKVKRLRRVGALWAEEGDGLDQLLGLCHFPTMQPQAPTSLSGLCLASLCLMPYLAPRAGALPSCS